MTLLLIGAAISIITSVGTSLFQAKIHRQYIIADRELSLVREAVEFNATTTGQIISAMRAFTVRLNLAETEIKNAKRFSAKQKGDLADEFIKLSQAFAGYDARAEALNNLLHIHFPGAKMNLSVSDTKKSNPAPGLFDMGDRTTDADLVLMRKWIEDEIDHAEAEQRRINSELAKVGQSVLTSNT